MTSFRQTIAMFAALLAAAWCAVLPGAAQTITNTAQAGWLDHGVRRSVSSNPVSFAVAAQPVRIEVLQASSSGEQVSFRQPVCGAAGGAAGGATPITVALSAAGILHARDPLYVRVRAPGANRDATRIEQIHLALDSAVGDREDLTVYETAENSGQFVGMIRTVGAAPASPSGDCLLAVAAGQAVSVAAGPVGTSQVLAALAVEVLADPFGLLFDSETGAAIDGVRVTLIDAASGNPARVFADDGKTAWPSTVVSGQPVLDGSGRVHAMLPGEYRFPLAALGRYRVVVDPPAGYGAPSVATPGQLAGLRRPDGQAFQIGAGSYGEPFALDSLVPVRIDIPLDPAAIAGAVRLAKTASRQAALPGDVVVYTLTLDNPDPARARRGVVVVDEASPLLRLRADTVEIDGAPAAAGAVTAAGDGRGLSVMLGTLAPGARRVVRYAMTVRADAPAGVALNQASVRDARGSESKASVAVRVLREDLAARVTLLGRITAGGCTAPGAAQPLGGVRVLLEDGSFALTDGEGRYHFAGLVPGSHVVQVDRASLPAGSTLVDCAPSTRSAGNPGSRFVSGTGGSLVVADFAVQLAPGAALAAPADPADEAAAQAAAERQAAGAETDWLALGDGPPAFLFPAPDHNPRAPAVRVAIRHKADQQVTLKVAGRPVDPLTFDGTRQAPGGRYAVSLWRAVPLSGETTRLSATLRGPGDEIDELTREVHFAQGAARIALVPAASRLVADGRSRPVLALRISDRSGRPVRAGSSGTLSLSAPYESAEALAALQQRALTGQARPAPRWHVRGDDGLAYVELAPTMVSGKLVARFDLSDGETRRHSELEAWLAPGAPDWTVVGLAETSLGAQSVADQMQRTGQFDSDLGDAARIAVYARGPLAPGVLLTAAYDSARQRDDQQLFGAIDPAAYYSVFADLAERQHDAASRDKLYARVEATGFTALYGDFATGFDQTELARYQRSATGVKAELARGALHVQGFAAETATLHRRDELAGAGISGPYRLSSRAIVPGSEEVILEVRDRVRSERVLSRRPLVRFLDYDLDLLAGTISFKAPLLSRDAELNPQLVVVSYELDPAGATGGPLHAGLRGDLTVAGGDLRIGASVLSEPGQDGAPRQTLAAADLRARLAGGTELRGEIAVSLQREHAVAWLVEAEHHDGALDLLGYARYADADFGLGQTSGAQLGRRKLGLDARYRLGEALALTARAWLDQSLTDPAERIAAQLGASWQGKDTDARLGLALMRDQLADGRRAQSTVLEGGVTRRLLDNRLELSASSALALDQAASVDLPSRHRLTARYALSHALRLVGSYELASGSGIEARTAQAGVELTPWSGARVTTGIGQQQLGEAGARSYALFGLAQSVPVSPTLTLDATLDSNRTLSRLSPADLVNPAQPPASGTLGESFTALTLGGSWRLDRWSANLRGEWRDGEQSRRHGVTLGAMRQLGEGAMLGTGLTWTRATTPDGAASEILDGALALAHRPAGAPLALLAKLEYRSDRVDQAIAGETGPAGRAALTITGSGRTQRLIASLSGNWSPRRSVGDQSVQRHELGFFAAVRRNLDRFEGYDLAGTTLLGGVDASLVVAPRVELGVSATVRRNLSDRTTRFAVGPQLRISPAKDMQIAVGYNLGGFRDPDFAAARTTQQGPFVTLKVKFDETLLGLTGRR